MNLTTCYIALGSNLDDPHTQIITAIEKIKLLPESTLAAVSSFYRSNAMGPIEQADIINAVAELKTQADPFRLLWQLQAIEASQGRQRTQRWGPRTIDLDILIYGSATIHTSTLTIPHPGLSEREFVLKPLAEIAPSLILPDGRSIESACQTCLKFGLTLLSSYETPKEIHYEST